MMTWLSKVKRESLKPFRKLIQQCQQTLRELGKSPILVLGDSHALVLNIPPQKRHSYYFKVISVSGATLSGLQNPNSKTQALPIFEKALKKYKGNICILQLGEVDAGFIIWYRSKKYNLCIEEALEKTISNYCHFISSIPSNVQVICISAPLPTIKDNQPKGEIANLRKEVTANQEERTQLTLKFNQIMSNQANKLGFQYINLDNISLNKDGVVCSSLLNKDSRDHHYDQKAYLAILLPRLQKEIAQYFN